MQYVVKFGKDEGRKYALFYSGFIIGGNKRQAPRKNIEAVHLETATIGVLQSVSDPVPGVDPREHARTMRAGAQSITLDAAQRDLVAEYLETYCCHAAASVVSEAADIERWFKAIQPTEPKGTTAKGAAKRR
jgi:hypothetical protein